MPAGALHAATNQLQKDDSIWRARNVLRGRQPQSQNVVNRKARAAALLRRLTVVVVVVAAVVSVVVDDGR